MEEELQAPGPETTPLEPVVTEESAITVESLHAMILELQGTVANLQAVADQATPVEPAAEEQAAEEAVPEEGALLEEEPAAEAPPEEDLEEVDALLQAN